MVLQQDLRYGTCVALACVACILLLVEFTQANYLSKILHKETRTKGVDRKWDIGPLEGVLMSMESTDRYPLHPVVTADNDWNASLPIGGGLIRLGRNQEIFSISMFHQLRCLGIIRDEFVAFIETNRTTKPGRFAEQCMDYLRQMVLCRADLRLESCRNPHGPRIAVSDITHVCKDWQHVFEAAQANYKRGGNKRK